MIALPWHSSLAFKDYFSVARDYARYRPHYPKELFEFLASLAPAKRVVWDVGSGSGQAAQALVSHFTRVVATDPSLSQLARAESREISRVAVRAEEPPLKNSSIDLVTVAQALHWFDFDRFYAAVRRVTRPGAIVAAWTYPLASLGEDVDSLLARFARETVGDYWPPERRHVDLEYRRIPFPFERIETPEFEMTAEWSLDDLLGYAGTWSAVNRYRQATGDDPLPDLALALRAVWGGAKRRAVRWSLPLFVGRAPGDRSGTVRA